MGRLLTITAAALAAGVDPADPRTHDELDAVQATLDAGTTA
ncbi:hypothetical protein [Actinokineospora globicatena]|nr:hypothetical protein [Actinokineospora globicatena]